MSLKITIAPTYEAAQRPAPFVHEELEPVASQLGRLTLEGIAVGAGLASLAFLAGMAAAFIR